MNSLKSSPVATAQSGLALVAVLWVVVALAMMVMGISQVLRSEARMTSQQQAVSIDTGVADAAIRQLLAQLHHEGRTRHGVISSHQLQVLGRDVKLDVIPLNGWINLNHAPASLIADALVHAAGMSTETAQSLAQTIVQKRQLPDAQGKPQYFQSVEDLLQQPEIQWDQYVALSDLLTTALGSESTLPNPQAAPLAVLKVLARGQTGIAQGLVQQRQISADTADTSALNGAHYQRGDTPSIEIRATLTSGDNTGLTRTWRVSLGTPAHGLPWRVLGMDPVRQSHPPFAP